MENFSSSKENRSSLDVKHENDTTLSKHVVNNFTTSGGYHCITNSLKQIFNYYNHPMTEEMLFGIASGLSFTYLNLSSGPFISGRTKVFEFEEKLARRLNISIKCKQSTSFERTTQKIKKLVSSNTPVLTYVDMYYLKYLHMYGHFGGHSVILFGYDDQNEVFYISDRDNNDVSVNTPKGDIHSDYHLVPYDQFKNARSSKNKPYPTNNKYLEIDFTNYCEVNNSILKKSILEVCNNMLSNVTQMNGVNGIRKFSKEIKKWDKLDPKTFHNTCINNFFQIDAGGGTGGGIFRKMYGQFLIESGNLLDNDIVRECGKKLIQVSYDWDKLSINLFQLGKSRSKLTLLDLSKSIQIIASKEEYIYISLSNALTVE